MVSLEHDPLLSPQGNPTQERMAKDELQWRSESTYWFSRTILYRTMGFVYLVAFLVSAQQNKALIGDLGLIPVRDNLGGRPTPFFKIFGFGDAQLDVVAWLGVLCSTLMMFAAISTCLLPFLCWLLYLSIVNLQSDFIMGYGWEWQVLETGFLVMFLYPVFSRSPFPKEYPTPFVVIFLCRWLAFRVMLGTGLSKMGTNASVCWRQLTCTTTHYETQPIPNAIAWFMHHLPLPIHKLECVIALTVELVTPVLMLVPFRNVRIVGGILPIFLMAMIIITGSYAYINWITLVPFAACFDDAFLKCVFPAVVVAEVQHADSHWAENAPTRPSKPFPVIGAFDFSLRYNPSGTKSQQSGIFNFAQRALGMLACTILAAVVATKSVNPLLEMMGPSPWLQFYDEYFLVNAYGVFGFINKERIGVALEYTHDRKLWKNLDFPAVPGSPNRMPAYVTPYHYRADWQVWIETTASMEQNPFQSWAFGGVPSFMQTLIEKVVAGDTLAASLLAVPFSEMFLNGQPPVAVRATPYLYTYSDFNSLLQGHWWNRSGFAGTLGQYMTPVLLDKAWSGEVSHLPPTRDWVLLYITFGFAASLIALVRAPSDHMEHCIYAGCGTWIAATGFLSVCFLPVWKSAWIVGVIVAVALPFLSHMGLRKLCKRDGFMSENGLSYKRCVCASAFAIVFFLAFTVTLSGFYMTVVGVLVPALASQLGMLMWTTMHHPHFDGLLIAVTALTAQALLVALQTATFSPPSRL